MGKELSSSDAVRDRDGSSSFNGSGEPTTFPQFRILTRNPVKKGKIIRNGSWVSLTRPISYIAFASLDHIKIRTRPERHKLLVLIFTDAEPTSNSQIELDSTTQESLRSQYVPPEPKVKILSRPKLSDPNPNLTNGGGAKNKKAQITKTLQQVELTVHVLYAIRMDL